MAVTPPRRGTEFGLCPRAITRVGRSERAGRRPFSSGAFAALEGHLDINNRSGDRQFIVERVLAPSDAARCLTDRIELRVPMQEGESSKAAQERLRMTAGFIKQAGGSQIADGGHAASILLHLDLPDRQVTLKSGLRVVPHEQLLQQLTEMLGGCDQVRLIGTIPHAAEKPSYKNRRS